MRCRFCHKSGHNRNSCPDAAAAAIAAKQAIAEGAAEYDLNWKHRFALQIERNKAQISANAAARDSSGIQRKCSYCSEAGHTRAKCALLSSDKTSFVNYETRFRNAFVRWMKNGGIGVGAMMERQSEWDEHKFVIMITSCNTFDNVGILDIIGANSIRGTYLNRAGWEGHTTDYAIPSGTGFPFAETRYGYKIVAPAPIPFELSADYLNETKIKESIDPLFDEKPKREYRWHRQKGNWGIYNSTRPNLNSIVDRVTMMETAANNSEVSAA